VVVGSKKLLEQHLEKAVKLGIPAIRYTSNMGDTVPSDIRILFMAVETASSKGFKM